MSDEEKHKRMAISVKRAIIDAITALDQHNVEEADFEDGKYAWNIQLQQASSVVFTVKIAALDGSPMVKS